MATKAAQGGASALPVPSSVVAIRRGVKVPKANLDRDASAIALQRLLGSLERNEDTEGQAAWALAQGVRRKLPSGQLRCIHSTLDATRDFDLRCLEVEAMRAAHNAAWASNRVLAAREGVPWWESEAQAPLVNANNDLWDEYRSRLCELAETPAQTPSQAKRKRELIGKQWLRCEGEFYDRLRAGVATDEKRLGVSLPPKRRA